MEVGESISPPNLTDVTDECPFDHELEDPPKIKNNLIGKGSTLASSMKSGSSTNLYAPYAPDEGSKLKHGPLPQKDSSHKFYRKGADKGRCIEIKFPDNVIKKYPVSCSAHHLVPSQEALKGHELLEYMCSKPDGAQDHNHSFGGGVVWSDVGYDTNGSENGVYLPGNYAVGGGIGGLNVWYPVGADDEEHDDGYIDDEKPPAADYVGYELKGVRGQISVDNKCWEYVAKAMKESKAQFHDRHLSYSNEVKKALTNIYTKYQLKDVTLDEQACGECKKRQEKLKEKGLPAPYSVVNRLKALSKNLRAILVSGQGLWRTNIYTSEWVNSYMQAVKLGGAAKQSAEKYK